MLYNACLNSSSSPSVASFAALVRTTGDRPMLDTLQSLALQSLKCVPVVIVHGDAETYARVKRNCDESSAGSSAVVLHANHTDRKRGYPINVGLDYCLEQLPGADFLFLLDDDDIVYPFFTRVLAAAFLASQADVVYAASNRREPGQPASSSWDLQPVYHLLRHNFITSNSYAIRLEALRKSGLRMTEELEYGEDWQFLIRMLEAGFRFHPISMTLSEFRLYHDGDSTHRRDLQLWTEIDQTIRRDVNTRSFPVPGADLVTLVNKTMDSTVATSAQPTPPTPLPTVAESTSPPSLDSSVADEALVTSLRDRIFALENSLSWRWTAPVRSVVGALQRLRGPDSRAQKS